MTHTFTQPVVTNADLTTSSDPAALVGAGPLPVQPLTPISGAGGGIFAGTSGRLVGADNMDLVVAGDTVYVALSNGQTSTSRYQCFLLKLCLMKPVK